MATEYEPASVSGLIVDNGCGAPSCWWRRYGNVFLLNPSGGANHTPDSTSSISVAEADNLAKTEFVKRVREVQGELQSLVVGGELAKTISGIVRPGKSLRNLWRTLVSEQRRAVRKAARSRGRPTGRGNRRAAMTRAVTGTYLEGVFGMMPTIHDLDEAAKQLAKYQTQQTEWVLPVRGVGRTSTSYISVYNIYSSYGPLKCYHNVGKTNEAVVKYQGAVACKPSTYNTLQSIGLVPSQFVPSLWELIPYSWLVDYFLNVGEVLEAYGTVLTSLKWSARTQRQAATAYPRDQRVEFTEPYLTRYFQQKSWTPGKLIWSRVAFTRSQYSGSYVPALRFRIPGTTRRWTNVSAVVAQSKATERLIRRLL